LFEHIEVTAAGFQHRAEAEFGLDQGTEYDLLHDADYGAGADLDHDLDAARFDDSDGAYAVAEPDPFSHPPAVPLRRPALRPALRAELDAQQAGAITTLTAPALPPLPVPDGLRQLLPGGLRRGSTVAITSSVSLLLALLGPASAAGAWTAMVSMPVISAEAAVEAGIELERLAIISPPRVKEDRGERRRARTGPNDRWDGSDAGAHPDWTGASWTTAVGALLDAVDVVVARPSGVSDGDARRLTARARSKGGILVLFGPQAASWPAVEIELSATHGRWTGIDRGYGRLRQRQLRVAATGRGRSARPRNTELWL
jgi:hypothetical protein